MEKGTGTSREIKQVTLWKRVAFVKQAIFLSDFEGNYLMKQ